MWKLWHIEKLCKKFVHAIVIKDKKKLQPPFDRNFSGHRERTHTKKKLQVLHYAQLAKLKRHNAYVTASFLKCLIWALHFHD